MITFGIKDIIDIVLVALLLYYIYRLMKESSSANIFAGILVLIVVWIFVSHIFEMRLLGGLLDRVVNMGAIALIILFQEEIRHFFSSIGTRRSTHFLRRLFNRNKAHQRLKAAGCILPVSHDTDIPKSLGLRHRAALGISQKSDCIAIIVSEETGGISIAEGGQFYLRLSAEELERHLTARWTE